MKTLNEFILEAEQETENVYVVYFEDGTMENYYFNKSEADEVKDKLNKECPANKCVVKVEKKTNFETNAVEK